MRITLVSWGYGNSTLWGLQSWTLVILPYESLLLRGSRRHLLRSPFAPTKKHGVVLMESKKLGEIISICTVVGGAGGGPHLWQTGPHRRSSPEAGPAAARRPPASVASYPSADPPLPFPTCCHTCRPASHAPPSSPHLETRTSITMRPHSNWDFRMNKIPASEWVSVLDESTAKWFVPLVFFCFFVFFFFFWFVFRCVG